MQSRIAISDVERAVGLKVRQFRQAKGWTQENLAKELGITYQQVCKYESGLNRLSIGMLIKVAAVFNLSVLAFLDGDTRDVSPRNRSALTLLTSFNAMTAERQNILLTIAKALVIP